jgi:hypothetical protein
MAPPKGITLSRGDPALIKDDNESWQHSGGRDVQNSQMAALNRAMLRTSPQRLEAVSQPR